MSNIGRTLLTLAVFAAAMVLGVSLQAAQAHADVAPTTTVVVVHTADPGGITEDDPRFNPCTMGVDGTYPETDPRHWTPGPCNLTTELPGGLRFQLVAEVVADSDATCADGKLFTAVTVLVVNPDASGDVRGWARAYGCARSGDPSLDFGDVLPTLFHKAAAQV